MQRTVRDHLLAWRAALEETGMRSVPRTLSGVVGVLQLIGQQERQRALSSSPVAGGSRTSPSRRPAPAARDDVSSSQPASSTGRAVARAAPNQVTQSRDSPPVSQIQQGGHVPGSQASRASVPDTTPASASASLIKDIYAFWDAATPVVTRNHLASMLPPLQGVRGATWTSVQLSPQAQAEADRRRAEQVELGRKIHQDMLATADAPMDPPGCLPVKIYIDDEVSEEEKIWLTSGSSTVSKVFLTTPSKLHRAAHAHISLHSESEERFINSVQREVLDLGSRVMHTLELFEVPATDADIRRHIVEQATRIAVHLHALYRKLGRHTHDWIPQTALSSDKRLPDNIEHPTLSAEEVAALAKNTYARQNKRRRTGGYRQAPPSYSQFQASYQPSYQGNYQGDRGRSDRRRQQNQRSGSENFHYRNRYQSNQSRKTNGNSGRSQGQWRGA